MGTDLFCVVTEAASVPWLGYWAIVWQDFTIKETGLKTLSIFLLFLTTMYEYTVISKLNPNRTIYFINQIIFL